MAVGLPKSIVYEPGAFFSGSGGSDAGGFGASLAGSEWLSGAGGTAPAAGGDGGAFSWPGLGGVAEGGGVAGFAAFPAPVPKSMV